MLSTFKNHAFTALIASIALSFSVSANANNLSLRSLPTVDQVTTLEHGIEEGDCVGHHTKGDVDCNDQTEHHT